MAEVNPFLEEQPAAAAATEAVAAPVQAVTDAAKGTWTVVRDLATKLFLYLPTSLVLFGFIADAIQEEFRYSIASLIGILSVFVNSFIGLLINLFVKNPTSVLAAGQGCTVPGFEALESIFAPQGIVLPVSIFTYFFIDFGRNRPPSENIGTAVLFGVYLLTHILVLWSSNCFTKYYWTNPFVTVGFGLLIGAILGSISYGIVYAASPGRLPSGTYVAPASSDETPNKKPVGPGGTPLGASSSSVGRCSAPNDQDQFVCEAYKNGQLVSSTISS